LLRIGVVLLLGVFVYATDCAHCEGKFKEAFFTYNGVEALYIGNNQALSIKNPKKNYRYNPFLHLYLIEGVSHTQSVSIKYPFAEEDAGLFQKNKAPTDTHLTKQCALRKFAQSSQKAAPFSIFSGLCCDVLALSNASAAVIDAKYLNDFIARKSSIYGDIGVRFNDKLEAVHINPYYDTGFEKGDKVTGESLCGFEEKILFAKPNGVLEVTVNAKPKRVTVFQRKGGGFVSDTFLEQFGMQFDAKLTITYVSDDSLAKQKGFKAGDRLLQIDDTAVRTQYEIRQYLTDMPKKSYNYLIERDDFQFFIRI
jgi:hypothetical protein